MIAFLRKRWFLLTLVLLITGGLTLGARLPREQIDRWSGYVQPQWITMLVLFLMAFSLDTAKLRAAAKSPAPVLWAAVVNSAGIPLMALVLIRGQLIVDFRYGLMIAASVPCTLAAVSVWTRRAGGNDAVSLLITLVTNLSCFLVTPFWLNLAASSEGSPVRLDPWDMVWKLLLVVLVPTLLGQACRMRRPWRESATRNKTAIGVMAQGLILLLVFLASALKAGPELGNTERTVGALPIAVVWASCIGLHLAAMGIGMAGGRVLGFAREDRAAVLFGSSQKTLPIGVYLATDAAFFGQFGFAVFPMVMFHASQLFIDTLVADRLAARGEKAAGTANRMAD